MAYFNSKAQIIMNVSDIKPNLEISQEKIMNDIGECLKEGSDWTIDGVLEHHFNVVNYKPLEGKSYTPLPKELQNSLKGLINLKNEDNECFRWCHIGHLYPQLVHPEHIKKTDKKIVQELNYQGVDFSVSLKDYNKIEVQNNININVFGYENKQFYPIYVSKQKNEDISNLLLITKDENKHYVLIKDFNRMMYNKTKHKEKKHFCMYCLQNFTTGQILLKHKDNCMVVNGKQAIRMPNKGENIVQFKNHQRQMPAPFVIYAEFEAITEKIQGREPNKNKLYTDKYQKHTSCSYGYKVVFCYDDKYTKPVKLNISRRRTSKKVHRRNVKRGTIL